MVVEPFTNPYVHIRDMYRMGCGAKTESSSSSEYGGSEGIPSEKSLEAMGDFEFQNFLNGDLEINDNELLFNGDDNIGTTDGGGIDFHGSEAWDLEKRDSGEEVELRHM